MERRGPFVLAGILFLVGVSVGQDAVRTKAGAVHSSTDLVKSQMAPAPPAQKQRVLANYSRLPLSFEPNQGQAGSPVKYLARGGQFNVFLTPDEVVFGFARRHARRRSVFDLEETAALEPAELSSLELRMVDANPSSPVVGVEELRGKANYLVGRDRSQWHLNLPTFAKVRYSNVYPGVDLLYYGNQGELESDFIIAPGANPEAVKLSIVGAEQVTLDSSGDVVLRMKAGELRLRKPLVYQEAGNRRKEIAGSYVLASNNQVGFRVSEYDHQRPLIVDPVLSYSTYLGGNQFDEANAIAVDSNGNAYITGDTSSTTFPTTTGPGTGDMFVAKLDANGAKLYATYAGGTTLTDFPTGVGVDALGNAYVVGQTSDRNLPTTKALRTAYQGGSTDGFVFSLQSGGTGFNYFTYLGGGAFDLLSAVAVDTLGNAYITGQTTSGDYPTLNPFQAATGGGIFTSSNTGTSWNSTTPLMNTNITSLVVDPQTPATVYAATNESGILKSTTSGTAGSWTQVNSGLTNLLINAMVIDPVTTVNLYVGTQGSGVFVSNNSGASWATMNNGLGGLNVTALAIDPNSPGTLYAAARGSGVGSVFKFSGASGSWTATGALPTERVNAIVVDPINGQNVYVVFQNLGVYKSTNGGTSWSASNTGLSSLQVTSLALDRTATHLYAATRTGGVFLSTNGASSWSTINTGLPFAVFFSVTADPTNSTTVYVGSNNAGVYRSTNSGGNWTSIAGGTLNNTRITALAVDPVTPTNLYAGSVIIDAIVTKLNSSGGLVFSSWLGGSGASAGSGIAIDGDNGSLYLAGFTNSRVFPTVAPAGVTVQTTLAGGLSGIVSKVKPDGSGLVYSTYLGGSGNQDQALAIAADSAGNAYIAGLTNSTDFPTVNPLQTALAGASDAFVAQYNASGQKMFATYLGGEGSEVGYAITATANTDGSTTAWVAGSTSSQFFPLANPIQLEQGGGQNQGSNTAFVSAINFPTTGAPKLAFSTYLGGGCGPAGCDTIAQAVGHDSANNIYVAGLTLSHNFPTVNPVQNTLAGPQNAFIAKIGATTNSADISLTLDSFGPTTVVAGGQVAFSLTVTNNGPNDATNVSLGGRGGGNLTLVTCTVTQGICGNNLLALDRGFAELGTLPQGASAIVSGTLVALVPCGVAGVPACPYVIEVDARSDANDPNPNNNSVTSNLTVLPGADLAVTLSESPTPAVGGALTYAAVVANLGPSPASNVTAVLSLVPATAASFVLPLPTGCANSAPGTLTCAIGPMSPGTSSPGSITVTVNSLPIVATIVVTNTPEADPNPSNNFATVSTAPADLAVAMTASPSPVPVLGSVNYQITVTNNGPSPATGVVLADTLPAGTVFASIDDLTDCTVSNGTLTCNFGGLAAGSSIAVNLILVPLAVPSGPGTFDNTASVVANELDPTLSNNSATQTVQVTGATLPGGGAFRNRLGFSNSILGPNDDSSTGRVPLNFNLNFFGVQVSSVFVNNNGNITFDSALGTFTPFPLTSTNQQIIAPYFSDVETAFPGSGLVTYGNDTVNGRPAFGVNWPNVEYFGEGSPNLLNLFQLVLVDRSDVNPGDFDIELNYDKIQWETGDASGGVGGLGGASARVGYSNGSGAGGSFFELPGSGVPGSFLDTNPALGLINNDLNSKNDLNSAPQLGRYVFQVRGGVVQSSADLAISASGPQSAAAGSTISYTLTATNLGPNPATGVTVTDTLPVGFTFVSAVPSTICPQPPTPAPGQPVIVTCNVGSLANGSSVIITIQAAIPASASGQAVDTAVVSVPNNQDLNLGNNSAPPVVTNITSQVADLTITKTHVGNFVQGQTGATYTITVSNSGTGATSGTVTVSDTLPTGLTATAISGTGWTCPSLTSCNRSDALAAGASYPAIALTVNVAANAPSQVTNIATVAGGGEINTANDSSSDLTVISSVADLTVTKTHTGNFVQGQTGATYTITVTNSGAGATTGTVSVNDTVPAGLTAIAISGTGWTCPSLTSCNRSDALAAGASYPPITLTVDVAANAPASVSNTVTVSGGGELNTTNDTANDPTSVGPASADLAVTVAVAPPTDASGTTVTYAVTVTNNGPSSAASVNLTDQLTGNASFVSPPPTGCTLPSSTSLDCQIGTLNKDGQVTFNISVQLTGAGWISNTAHVTSQTPDPILTNNAAPVQKLSPGGNTVTGFDVAVQPVDSTTGASPAVLTFSNVTRGGTTTLSSSASGPALPSGFRSGTPAVFYNLATTAGYSGPISVALGFNGVSFHHPANLRLFHYENGAWVDRTVAVSTAGGYAIALVTSLSPFALFEPLNQTPVANPGPDRITGATGAQGAKVTLDGSASSDADHDTLTYRWTGPFPEGNGVVTGVNPAVTMPLGANRVTLVVNDSEADSAAVFQTITVTDFSMTAAAAGPTTISAGGSVSFNITASPQFGPFPAAVSLACLGLPQGAQCNFSPATVNAGGPAAVLTITTAPRMVGLLAPIRHGNHAPLYALWMPLPAIALMGLGARRRSRKHAALLMLLLLLGMMLLLVSCGGGSMGVTPQAQLGTPAGNFSITVTGTANGSLQHTTTASFTVQ